MIIPEGYAQCNLRWEYVTTQLKAECVFGLSRADMSMNAETMAGNVEGAYTDGDLRTIQTEFITLTSILIKFGPNDTGPSFELPVSHQGTLSGEGITPNTSLLLRKLTSVGGRKGRGRAYWPGIQEGIVDSYGNLDPSAQSTFQDKFDTFMSDLSDSSDPMVVLHASGSTTPPLVTSFVVQPVVATQRRRLRH